MSHVVLSGRVVSGTLEFVRGAAFLRTEVDEWESLGLRIGQAVEADTPDTRNVRLVVRHVLKCPAGEPWAWVWFSFAPKDAVKESAHKAARTLRVRTT